MFVDEITILSLDESCTCTFCDRCVCCSGDMHVRSNVAFFFFGGGLWSDADFVDESKYAIPTSAQHGFPRVQAGKKDGRLESQDESVIIVA